MKITQGEDKWFIFHTSKGREIRGQYTRQPGEKKASMLILMTLATDPTGQPTFSGRQVPVRGFLNLWELRREGEKVERNAEGIERGDPPSPHIEQHDLRKSSIWRDWLGKHPEILKEHPHFLEDLQSEENPSH